MYTEVKVPNKATMILLNQAMAAICQPLELLGIDTFNYVRIYKDGSRIDLNSRLAYLDNYYHKEENYLQQSIEGNPFQARNKIVVWTKEEGKLGQIMGETFQANSGIIFIQTYTSFCELFHFICHDHDVRNINFYVNHQDTLQSFILYFKDKAKKLIQKADQNRIMLPKGMLLAEDYKDKKEHETLFNNKLEQFLQMLDIKRWHFPFDESEVYLTKQELTCLKWSITGKSAEEISVIMGTSRRTCEAHLENVKKKLNCHKQLVVGYKLAMHIPQQLLDLIG
jgi:DNA-binding CsgD family transcriptional regulator